MFWIWELFKAGQTQLFLFLFFMVNIDFSRVKRIYLFVCQYWCFLPLILFPWVSFYWFKLLYTYVTWNACFAGVKACMEAMHPVDEEPYEVNLDNHGCCNGPRTGRLMALNNVRPILWWIKCLAEMNNKNIWIMFPPTYMSISVQLDLSWNWNVWKFTDHSIIIIHEKWDAHVVESGLFSIWAFCNGGENILAECNGLYQAGKLSCCHIKHLGLKPAFGWDGVIYAGLPMLSYPTIAIWSGEIAVQMPIPCQYTPCLCCPMVLQFPIRLK